MQEDDSDNNCYKVAGTWHVSDVILHPQCMSHMNLVNKVNWDRQQMLTLREVDRIFWFVYSSNDN